MASFPSQTSNQKFMESPFPPMSNLLFSTNTRTQLSALFSVILYYGPLTLIWMFWSQKFEISKKRDGIVRLPTGRSYQILRFAQLFPARLISVYHFLDMFILHFSGRRGHSLQLYQWSSSSLYSLVWFLASYVPFFPIFGLFIP